MLNEIDEAVSFLKTRQIPEASVGVILGTGLGKSFVEQIKTDVIVPYTDIPHFPHSTVESHQGRLIFGSYKNIPIVTMQGRFHYYEGYNLQQVTFPVRVMKQIGIKYLLISNAAGNLNRAWKRGDLMLLDDHINLQTDNPLRGKNLDSFGPRFPDMSRPYSLEMNDILETIASRRRVDLHKGVYACVSGPNLETRAEYRFLQRIGADAVGMSTVPEVIVANHMGLPCCAVSVLTDDCDPDNLHPVELADILEVARKAEPQLTDLFLDLILQLK